VIQIFLVYIKYIYFALDLPLLNVEATAEEEEGYTLTIYIGGRGHNLKLRTRSVLLYFH
jgi:hypothetical protein